MNANEARAASAVAAKKQGDDDRKAARDAMERIKSLISRAANAGSRSVVVGTELSESVQWYVRQLLEKDGFKVSPNTVYHDAPKSHRGFTTSRDGMTVSW